MIVLKLKSPFALFVAVWIGSVVPLSEKGTGNRWQHRNFGDRLLKTAEDISRERGYTRVAVMSGIGVRPYYNKRGYIRCGPYMIKELE